MARFDAANADVFGQLGEAMKLDLDRQRGSKVAMARAMRVPPDAELRRHAPSLPALPLWWAPLREIDAMVGGGSAFELGADIEAAERTEAVRYLAETRDLELRRLGDAAEQTESALEQADDALTELRQALAHEEELATAGGDGSWAVTGEEHIMLDGDEGARALRTYIDARTETEDAFVKSLAELKGALHTRRLRAQKLRAQIFNATSDEEERWDWPES